MLERILASIAKKKAQFDRPRSLSASALAQLQKYYDVELAYTSNAIEGNTLTLRETAEVIEHGITVGGKSLRDHLEAVDHYGAHFRLTANLEMIRKSRRAGNRKVAIEENLLARSGIASARPLFGNRVS